MAAINVPTSQLGNALQDVLMADEIVPGSTPSYQICKAIYTFHPLGALMAENPIKMAQSVPREISVPGSPESVVVDQFKAEAEAIKEEDIVLNVMAQARAYGITSLALLEAGVDSNTALDFKRLAKAEISFNVFDPLNTAGSLVLNQLPNALDFQKHRGIAVQGQAYHRSRCITMMNERPIYISYTASGFGFVGRSVYQRALFPLKSFIQTLVTDDMVTRKAGVLVAKIKPAGSIVDNIMAWTTGLKRAILKQAETDNVISVGNEDAIESLNFQNLEGPYGMVRKNILENVAASAGMPAMLLNSETFAQGFADGTEDAKHVARYIDRVRREMQDLYGFIDTVVQYRAWTEEFYATVQKQFPEEYGRVDYQTAFYQWKNAFTATWPNLLTEPDSEKSKEDKVKLEAIVQVLTALLPSLDPMNKATLIEWAADNLNDSRVLFSTPLVLDTEALANYEPPVAGGFGDEGGGGFGGAKADMDAGPRLLGPGPRLNAARKLITMLDEVRAAR